MTLTLYGFARSRVSRCLWMLEEIGEPYRHVSVDKGPQGLGSEAFARLNPNATAPTLVDGDFVMWESLAINLYLARRSGGALGPADAGEDARMTMWSLWAATTVETDAHDVFVQTLREPADQRDAALAAGAFARLRRPLETLERSLRQGDGFLVGRRFTVADLNVACILFYLRGMPDAFRATPAIDVWYGAATRRPAFLTMVRLRETDAPSPIFAGD